MSFRSLVKAVIPKGLFRKIEPFGHLCEAVLLNILNGFPGRKLKIIGVTGTNGKTTTSFLIHRMMHEAGYKVGLMTTVAYGAGDNIKPQIEHMTTVSVPQLMKRLKQIRAGGAEWLVLETTSHGLGQNRVWGIPYSVAVLTNLTHEHLEYHGTFERYKQAKLKMFKVAAANKKGLQTGVVNADDASAKVFSAVMPKALSYGVKKGELRAKNIKSSPKGSEFTAESKEAKLDIKVNLPGSFNVENALAAAGVGLVLGMEAKQIEQGIASLKSVEGRMNTVDAGQNFSVIVDFAHTPDSFEKLLSDLKPMVTGKMIVMFGSAGRRDKAKRPLQGETAGKYADEVVLTEEDDRDENGQQILEEIAVGAEKSGKERGTDLFLVHDREEAIKYTLGRAGKGDTVLLLGKGHETNIARAHGEDPWNEIAITEKALKELNK